MLPTARPRGAGTNQDAIDGGINFFDKFLGHITMEMTADIYTHTSGKREREARV